MTDPITRSRVEMKVADALGNLFGARSDSERRTREADARCVLASIWPIIEQQQQEIERLTAACMNAAILRDESYFTPSSVNLSETTDGR